MVILGVIAVHLHVAVVRTTQDESDLLLYWLAHLSRSSLSLQWGWGVSCGLGQSALKRKRGVDYSAALVANERRSAPRMPAALSASHPPVRQGHRRLHHYPVEQQHRAPLATAVGMGTHRLPP